MNEPQAQQRKTGEETLEALAAELRAVLRECEELRRGTMNNREILKDLSDLCIKMAEGDDDLSINELAATLSMVQAVMRGLLADLADKLNDEGGTV